MNKYKVYYYVMWFLIIKFVFGNSNDLEIKERTWNEELTGLTYIAGCSTFQDDSLRLFIVRRGLRTYLKQMSILANGTVSSISLDSWGIPMGIQPNTMSPIGNKNVLFAYANGTEGEVDPENLIQKDTWAGIADEQGNLLHYVLLMENNEFNEHNIMGVNNTAHQLIANIDTFIYVYFKEIGLRCNTIEWEVFDDKANSIDIDRYELEMDIGCVHSYNTEPTLDGGFMIAWSVTETTLNSTNIKVYAVFLNPNSATRKTAPFIIFSSTIAYEIKILACAGSDIGRGFNCFLQALTNNSTEGIQSYQVNFLSSGMIHNVVPIESRIADKAIFGELLDVVGIPLQYGGFLLVHSSLRQNPFDLLNPVGSKSILDLFQPNGSLVKEKLVETVFTGGVCIFRNNTAVLTGISKNSIDYRTLSIFTIDLPKFHDQDNGYQNLNIYSSYPALNEQNFQLTKETSQPRLSLTYRGNVRTSGQGSIQIFQANDTFPRLNIPSNLITLVNENENFTQINFSLFSSTLNMPETQYYITVEDGTVETSELAEPLPGIKPAIWNFTTKKDVMRYSEEVTTLLRFNPDALHHFLQDPVQTINTIKFELSTFLPVSLDRLSTSKWYFGSGDDHSYILLPIQISPGHPSSIRLVSDLNDLILNFRYTNLRHGSMTNYLNDKYGAQVKDNFFIENRIILILTGCVLIIVAILYISANIRDAEARNFAIPQFALILSDFSLDLIFLVTHSVDVPFLFVPSLVFTVVPFTFNFFWSVYIIIVETIYNDDFLRWFKFNNALASTFTILASTEVEVLSILNSRAGGLKVLQAPWSNWAGYMIFMGSVIGFVIEDVPQFVIQVIYKLNTASYSIIPFLTLVTSSLVILHSIVGKLYIGIARWRKSKQNSEYNIDKELQPVSQEDNNKSDSIKSALLLKGDDKGMRAQIVEGDVRHSIFGEIGFIEEGQESEENEKK